MKPEILTVYSEEGKVQTDIEEAIEKHADRRLLTVCQVLMNLPSRTGAQAVVTTLVFVDV